MHSYEDAGYTRSDLSKVRRRSDVITSPRLNPNQMIFLLNGKPVDALALIVHRSAQQDVGRMWVKKLREWSSRFSVSLL